MIGFWTPVFAAIRAFFKVWGQALYDGTPLKFRQHLPLAKVNQRIRVEDENKLPEICGALNGNITFDVNEQLVLRHTLTFPAAIKNDFKNVVKLEAARLMPLQVEDLYITQKLQTNADKELLVVEVVAIRTRLVDTISRLVKQAGAHVHAINIVSVAGENIASISPPATRQRSVLRLASLVFLMGGILALFAVLPKLYLSRLNTEILLIEDEVRQQRRQTENVSSLQKQVENLRKLALAVQKEKRASRTAELLVLLTDISPNDVYLEEFRLNGSKLYLKGLAQSPESWALKLTEVEGFKDVTLSSVVGRGINRGGQFEIRMGLNWQAIGEVE